MTRRLFFAMLGLAVAILVLHEAFEPGQADVADGRRTVIELQRDAFALGLRVQDNLESDLDADGRRMIRHWTERLAEQHNATFAVADRTGAVIAVSPDHGAPMNRRVAGESRRTLASRESRFATGEVRGTRYQFATAAIVANQGVVGAVVVAKQRSADDRWFGARIGLTTPVFFVAVGLSALLAALFARILGRPLVRLQEASRHVAAGGEMPQLALTGSGQAREVAGAFNAMAVRVERSLARQSEFTSDVAHQLRTPLTTLNLSLQRIAECCAAGDLEGALVRNQTAQAEVVRLRRLVEGLLSVARAPMTALVHESIDLGSIARERVRAWSALSGKRSVSLDLMCPDEAWAQVVPGAVDQILDNLIDNALEVAPTGSSVEIAVLRLDARVEVSVRDHGPGIDRADRDSAFTRFWRGPDAPDRNPDGLGLGLAIVRDLAEASQGTVEMRDPPDGGLLVMVSFPAATRP